MFCPPDWILVNLHFRIKQYRWHTCSLKRSRVLSKATPQTGTNRNTLPGAPSAHLFGPTKLHEKNHSAPLCRLVSLTNPKCLWVKNRHPKWNPGKWKQGLKPAVPWWFRFDPYPNTPNGTLGDKKQQQHGTLKKNFLCFGLLQTTRWAALPAGP